MKSIQIINDKTYNKHWIYLDDDNTPLILPSLFSRHINRHGQAVILRNEKEKLTNKVVEYFDLLEIGKDAQVRRVCQLGLFLDWVDKLSKSEPSISLQMHTALPADVINDYVNNYLIEDMQKSENSVNDAVVSLKGYYNWLTYFFDNKFKHIGIYPSHRTLARANNKQSLVVKYLLPQTRELLYRHTHTLLKEIILRNGGELGCRTSENIGFLLNDFVANKKSHKGMLSLFEDMNSYPDKMEFSYHLSSLYTKYRRSRILYIPRELLDLMERYYNTERPYSDSNHLFVVNSNHNKGQCISKQFATDTFRLTLRKLIDEMQENPAIYFNVQTLSADNVYHHLRHSFGTDIFYGECKLAGKSYDSITTESRVYIETARRMGHKLDGLMSNQTTKTYIHSCSVHERLLEYTQ